MTVTGRLIPVATTWLVWFSVTFGQPSFSASVSSISTIMAKAHQCNVQDDQDRKQGQQACMVLPNVTVLISFFLTKGNKKILIHKEKSRFLFSATAHRDFEIFNMINQGLARIQSNTAKINPELTVNPEALLPVKVKNLHAVSYFTHPTCTQLHYARDFGTTALESAKRMTQWSAFYFTHSTSYYPVPLTQIHL